MSERNITVEMPKLLRDTQKSHLKRLNELLMKNTGCFAFLKDQIELKYHTPSTGYEAFWIYSTALYDVYHDYGCRYLDFILDNANAPDSSLEKRLKKCRNHKKDINVIFRTNLAHGVYDQRTREDLRDIISTFYLHTSDGEKWDSYINNLTEKQWKDIVGKIIRDANQLADTIEEWAGLWGRKDEREREALRRAFADSDEFYKSVDKRVCFSLRKDELGQKPDVNEGRIDIWRGVIQNEFRQKKICTPLDIRKRLQSLIHEVCNPASISSVGAAKESGYDISILMQ